MSLSHQDVQDILKILDDTDYNELTLETGNFALHLIRTADGKGWVQETRTASSHKPQASSTTVVTEEKQTKEPEAAEEGLLDIRAPMVGTFYRSPKPGADPFVSKGSKVASNTVIAIIEVMKLMNSIPAGVDGEIAEILVEDAQFVEKGQLLMRVRP